MVFLFGDATLYRHLQAMADQESIFLEPSAAAGLSGPPGLLTRPEGLNYLSLQGLTQKFETATHLAWATGGGMVPETVIQGYYRHIR